MADHDAPRPESTARQFGEAARRLRREAVPGRIRPKPITRLERFRSNERDECGIGPMQPDSAQHATRRLIKNAECPSFAGIEGGCGCSQAGFQHP